jgi:redox-sensitive bicupin YhaK (pirin superfamily)
MTTPLLLSPHTKDLGGGFVVRRTLPSAQRQSVGPFLFFDHFGPITAQPEDNHDVRPHPHIGLATVTYLFEGAMMHRDSTGVVQRIEPGAINWMTAGRGISHSERAPDDLRGTVHRSHGLQLWAALPAANEEDAPGFSHTAASAIPSTARDGVQIRVLIGEAFGLASPVPTVSHTVYVDLALQAGATLSVPAMATERALYGIDTAWQLDGQPVPPQTMVVLPEGSQPLITAPDGARRRPADADRRRTARPPLRVVELRVQPQRAHHPSRRRLGRATLRHRARRDRIHPAAGTPTLRHSLHFDGLSANGGRAQSNLQVADPVWPTFSAQSMPSTITPLIPNVTAPFNRASAR